MPEVRERLAGGENLVVQAEPGAGKTTRLPIVMLEAGLAEAGEIWVAQPRRIAARMAAERVASLLGERLGERVGFQVRFESKVSKDTRIRFVTEGILARRLVEDPRLSGVAAVVFDEFHERHLDGDLALALARALQLSGSALRIGVMSATLEPDPIAAWLGAAPMRCPGRAYPIEIEYADAKSDRPLAQQVAAALRGLADSGLDGGVLVFLPGAREIRECSEACEGLARSIGLELLTLHGELPSQEQDRAVRAGAKPKLVLATNVAETSITIDGIAAVIDSGLARQATHDPFTGLPRLALAKISKASAEQRAGRAGRTRAGKCVRLYPRHDFERRPAHDAPEIVRLDLAGAALTLRAAGLRAFGDAPWFEAPPAAAAKAADELLARLGAIDRVGALTERGRAMLRFPVHPRLARLLEHGAATGVPRLAAGAAALLSERSIRRGGPGRARVSAAADVLVDLDDLDAFARDGGRQGLDAGTCRTVLRVRDQLQRALPRGARDDARDPDDAMCIALLAAFPDRVAAVRAQPGGRKKLAFAGGSGQADLAEESAVADEPFVVALAAEERREGTSGARVLVRSAARCDPTWLLDLDADRLEERRVATFDATKERVDTIVETRWDGLVLESRTDPRPSPESTEVLLAAARSRGPAAWTDDADALADLRARCTFARTHDPVIAALDDADVEAEQREIASTSRTFADLRAGDLLGRLLARLGEHRSSLERLAPTHVTLPGSRRVRVHYETDRPPWIESRLQDFFGSATGPTIANGRIPLAIHLLAPNQRAVQITTDLAGFWQRHYPDIRKTLMRRYPKHDWPENGATATPPAPKPPRRR